jgi:Ca2+-binding EF-hand superfamily protein
MDKKVYMREENLFMAFKMFDVDNSGMITHHDLI